MSLAAFRKPALIALAIVAVQGSTLSALAQSQPADGARPAQPRERNTERQRGGQDGGGRGQPGGGGGGGGFGGGGFGGMFGGMGGGMGRFFEPSVTSKDLDGYSKTLGLAPEQTEVVTTLFDAYQQAFNEKAKEVRDRIETARSEARDSGDPSSWQKLGEEMNTFRKVRDQMEASLFTDVKAVLTPEQAERWPVIERQRRRETTVSRGLMSGERVDLVKVVDGLELAPEAKSALAAPLDQYQLDLDRELVQRNKVYEEAQDKAREVFMSGDPQAMQDMITKGREASIRVRDVNQRYARQIEPLLPESARAKFEEQVRRESFPLIYRTSHAQRVVEAAGNIPGLDDNQKSALTAIRETFTRESTTINRDMEKAYIKIEENFKPEDMMRGGGFFNNDDLRELRDRRRELETTTTDKIKAVLTEEQAKQLPERTEGREGGPDGPDGGGRQRQRRNNDGERRPAPTATPNGRL